MKKIVRLQIIIIVLLCVVISGGCNLSESKNNQAYDRKPDVPNEYFVNAMLFNFYAAEYKALVYQAFNSASDYLELLKFKNPLRQDMAIIVDIDETLLDNSPYQAKLYEINSSYDSLWNEWCNLAAARSVPGSVKFLQFADSLGFNIFYISNRKMKNVYQSTLKNLMVAGFPQTDSLHLLLRNEGNNKEKRRMSVSESYKIVMLVGDNIGDFYEDTDNYSTRDSLVNLHSKEFGRKLIVLPNAIYGNWVSSLGINSKRDVDSLISIMTLPFNKEDSSKFRK
jgi:5'-nucleotidase (lipoprotein e(P4) family)